MTALSRLFSILLWTLASFSLLFGVLATVSVTEAVRFVSVTDNSSFPATPAHSLELAYRTASSNVAKGDLILVGAHSTQGSTIGEVVAVETNKANTTSVILKAPNRATPDQWTYELGSNTYKHVAAVPLIGKLYLVAGNHMNPWVFGALVTLITILVLVGLRFWIFARAPRTGDHWFKKLEKPANNDVEVLMEIFEDQGLAAPTPHVKKRRRGNK